MEIQNVFCFGGVCLTLQRTRQRYALSLWEHEGCACNLRTFPASGRLVRVLARSIKIQLVKFRYTGTILVVFHTEFST